MKCNVHFIYRTRFPFNWLIERCMSLHPDQTVSMEDPSRVIEDLERTYSAISSDNTWCLRNVAWCGAMLVGIVQKVSLTKFYCKMLSLWYSWFGCGPILLISDSNIVYELFCTFSSWSQYILYMLRTPTRNCQEQMPLLLHRGSSSSSEKKSWKRICSV
jgi:hypothetical protein